MSRDLQPIQYGSLDQRWRDACQRYPFLRPIVKTIAVLTVLTVSWGVFQFGLGQMDVRLPFPLGATIALIGLLGMIGSVLYFLPFRQWIKVAITFLGVVVVGVILWPQLVVKFALWRRPPQAQAAASSQEQTQSSSKKYHDIQIVKMSNDPTHFQDILNLDGTAELIQCGDYKLDLMEMALLETTALRVDKPELGKAYPIGGMRKGNVRVFMRKNSDGTFEYRVLRAVNTEGAKKFVFKAESNSQLVEIGQRKFHVKMRGVHDRSEGKLKLVEFTFEIAEE